MYLPQFVGSNVLRLKINASLSAQHCNSNNNLMHNLHKKNQKSMRGSRQHKALIQRRTRPGHPPRNHLHP